MINQRIVNEENGDEIFAWESEVASEKSDEEYIPETDEKLENDEVMSWWAGGDTWCQTQFISGTRYPAYI